MPSPPPSHDEMDASARLVEQLRGKARELRAQGNTKEADRLDKHADKLEAKNTDDQEARQQDTAPLAGFTRDKNGGRI